MRTGRRTGDDFFFTAIIITVLMEEHYHLHGNFSFVLSKALICRGWILENILRCKQQRSCI